MKKFIVVQIRGFDIIWRGNFDTEEEAEKFVLEYPSMFQCIIIQGKLYSRTNFNEREKIQR